MVILIYILWGRCSCLWSVVSVTHKLCENPLLCTTVRGFWEKWLTCISHYGIVHNRLIVLKACPRALYPSIALTPDNYSSSRCLHSFAFLRMFYSWNHSSCHFQTVFVYKAIGLQASTISSHNLMTQHWTISEPQSVHLPSVGNFVYFQIWGIMKKVPTNTVDRASWWVWV